MKEATAFSPGHITGLFQVFDESEDPLLQGSRGAGVSITQGVTTRVCIKKASKQAINIRLNGKNFKSGMVSQHVLDTLLPCTENIYNVQVDHDVKIPISAGFGSSGASALSLALALNEVLELGLSRIETAQIAHIAEVKCRTGLGTVIAETFGGLEIREKPGAPGVGKIRQIPLNDNYVVAYLVFGPMFTPKALADKCLRRKINYLGNKLTNKLIGCPNPDNFMKLSRRFAENLGLISNRLRKVLVEADKKGVTSSLTMFGECLFSLVRRENSKDIISIFRKHALSRKYFFVSEIDLKGARLQ